MNSLSSIAISGMRAAHVRMEAAASNVANVPTEGFRRVSVTQTALAQGGTVATVGRAQEAGPQMAADLVEQKFSAMVYQANAVVLRTSMQTMGSLLNEKA